MPVAKITKTLVDGLRPKTSQFLVHDVQLKGFGVRVTPSGYKSFIIEYRPGEGGRRVTKKRMVIGVVGKITCAQARNIARKKLALVQLGENPTAEREQKRRMLTFSEMSQRYLSEEAPRRLKKGTIANYEINLRRHANPVIGRTKLSELARTDLVTMHNVIGAKSPVMANRTLETVSAVFRFAQELGIVPEGHNPTKGVRSFKEPRRERYLSEDEFMRLGNALELAETKGIPWAYQAQGIQSKHAAKLDNQKTVFSSVAIDAIRMLIFTGCRLREILDLTWDEVDLERELLFLADSKTGARVIVLNNLAQNILYQQPRSSRFVFPGEIKSIDENADLKDRPLADLNKPWRAVRRHAGIDDVRLHDLRHSFASVGASAGMSLPIVGALLGHKQPSTTERYAHLDASPLRQASDTIAAKIASSMKMA